MTATERCGSQLAGLALPVELQRGRADDDGGIGVVGLERRQRLDRLAQALLVGQEGAPGAQRVAHARPLEGRELAAEHGGGLGDRLAGRRARGADLAQRLVVLLAQLLEGLLGRAVDGDVVQGQEGVERLDDPRVDGQRVARPDGARQRVEGAGDVGVPEDVEAQEGPVDRLADGQPRGRRILAALERGDDAARGAVHARAAAQIGQRLGARLGQRRQQGAVLALDGALEQRLGHRARAGAQDPPAASVVARGRHDADPAALDGGQPGVDLRAGGQLREAVEHLGDVDPRPVVDGRPPLARVPVEAPLRDAPHGGDDLRVVGEGEDDDRPAVGATPQLDVGAFLDELHPPSR